MAEKRIIPPDWELKIGWNVKLFRIINSKRNKKLDRFYRYFFYMGKTYSLVVFFPVFFFVSGIKGILHLTVSLMITGIIMPLLKYTFRHKRPSKLLDDVYLLEPVTLKSFPSADAAFAFTVMGVMLFYGNVWIDLVFVLYALLIAYGRVYMGAHFPVDVIVGSVIGLFSAFAGKYAVPKVLSFIGG